MNYLKNIFHSLENPNRKKVWSFLLFTLIICVLFHLTDLNKIHPILGIILVTLTFFSCAFTLHIILSLLQKYIETKFFRKD